MRVQPKHDAALEGEGAAGEVGAGAAGHHGDPLPLASLHDGRRLGGVGGEDHHLGLEDVWRRVVLVDQDVPAGGEDVLPPTISASSWISRHVSPSRPPWTISRRLQLTGGLSSDRDQLPTSPCDRSVRPNRRDTESAGQDGHRASNAAGTMSALARQFLQLAPHPAGAFAEYTGRFGDLISELRSDASHQQRPRATADG